jgi:bile acid:Na+ symporter, BASS family
MNELIQFCQPIFNPLVLIFTVTNLLSMGLQVDLREMFKIAANPKFLGLTFGLGWIVGPAIAFLITLILPLDNMYVIVLFIGSLAPCAPFLPPLLPKAKGDVVYAGAFIPVAAIGTSILMPVIAPMLVKGIDLSVMSLLKPLFMSVLLPLIIGALIKTFASNAADKMFNPVKKLAGLSTLLTMIFCFLLYSGQMWATAGSMAMLSITIFSFVMGVIAYYSGFGLKRSEKVVLSLGIGTRNIAAVLIGVLTIPDVKPNMVAMVVIWTLWTIILSYIIAPIMGKKAPKEVPVNA